MPSCGALVIRLLKRMFDIDIEHCAQCGERFKNHGVRSCLLPKIVAIAPCPSRCDWSSKVRCIT